MFKKIIILSLLFFSFIGNILAYDLNNTDGITNDKPAQGVSPTISESNIKDGIGIDRDTACKISGNCIDQPTFKIKVDNISPGMKTNGKSTKENINHALGTIIQNLMIALGSLSLLVMTVGAGYIVLNGGQDELLNKGKSIFMAGVYSMVVALASYYIIVIVRYILYA